MLNYIWAFMILLGVVFAAFTGRMSEVTNAALDSAGEAISLCITMAGVMALWMGLMEIAQRAGVIEKMTKGISPFLTLCFRESQRGILQGGTLPQISLPMYWDWGGHARLPD